MVSSDLFDWLYTARGDVFPSKEKWVFLETYQGEAKLQQSGSPVVSNWGLWDLDPLLCLSAWRDCTGLGRCPSVSRAVDVWAQGCCSADPCSRD